MGDDGILPPRYDSRLGFAYRVAKCHRYGRLICVNFVEVWGKILECNIRASDVG